MTYPTTGTALILNPTVDVHRMLSEYNRRKIQRSPLIEACRAISTAYNNQIALPMPEVNAKEAPSVANLISSGIDQHAQRISSVLPDIQCPPTKPGVQSSEDRAAVRRRAAFGYWDVNHYELKTRKRARWLIAYSTAPVWVRPDMKLKAPHFDLRSPLNTYPSDDDALIPDNVIFGYTRNVAWLKQHYPGLLLSLIRVPNSGLYSGDRGLLPEDPVEVVQWLDADQTTTVVTGVGYCEVDTTREAEYGINGAQIINLTAGPDQPAQWAAVLESTPNYTGVPQVICPNRINLDMPRGQFDDAIGLFEMQAKLAAMEFNAIANSIWPDQWLVPGAPTESPRIVTMANGRAGKIGEISGGTIQTIAQQPGIQTPTTIDRLERYIRLSAAIPADFSGESASNVRTARRGAAILSEAVDYMIQEHQDTLARSMRAELETAALIDMTYFGGVKKSFYVNWPGGKGRLDYTPRDTFGEDRTCLVSYAKSGADVNALTVEVEQLVGGGLLSKETGMRMHPDIQDPDHEIGQIAFESIEAALLAGIQQQGASGAMTPPDIAAIGQMVRNGDTTLFDAVLKVHQQAQQRQATVAAASAPEAQPGLAQPGQGAEQPTAIPPEAPSEMNLTNILRALRSQSVSANQ